ncbi:ECF transporter S component [Clostridium sp. P21]|uniref:ECF transporter S component n=1 Tax=Clostridium muellerianum TaxID=2716538 RepID=A0A7Y0EJR4_9CLOT|nr:ECF transporter S component [Clostridium muellerianum]NMM64744.1 ECF transporter S component [Clostridium muellerianum]
MERGLKSTTKFSTRQLAVIGMLSSISIILGVTGLGFIPIPPVKATIMHVPVIIGAILEGPVVGAMVGLIFGIFSIIQSITTPTPVSFVFMNPLVSVIPRVLIGLTSYYVYRVVKSKSKSLGIGLGAAVGTLTNTVGVLGMIYLIYLGPYSKALNISLSTAKKGIVAVAVTNGIPEVILSVVIVVSVVTAVNKIKRK